jgi:hypothetical protein
MAKTQTEIFFNNESEFEKEWVNMLEFNQKNKQPIQKIIVSFESFQDVLDFGKLIGFEPTKKTKSVWFPFKQKDKPKEFCYVDTDK